MNTWIGSGNLGADPVSRIVEPSGTCHARFTMATTRYVPQNEGAPREETTWHTVESWGRLAMLVRDHLRKGRQVFVRGRLELQEWDHKTDRIASTGKPVRCSRTVVVADEIVFGAGERVAQQGGQNDHAR